MDGDCALRAIAINIIVYGAQQASSGGPTKKIGVNFKLNFSRLLSCSQLPEEHAPPPFAGRAFLSTRRRVLCVLVCVNRPRSSRKQVPEAKKNSGAELQRKAERKMQAREGATKKRQWFAAATEAACQGQSQRRCRRPRGSRGNTLVALALENRTRFMQDMERRVPCARPV